MITVNTLNEQTIEEPTAIALGYFDGLHLGHKAVIHKARGYKAKGLKTCVFSFSTSSVNPGNGKGSEIITTKTLKEKLMRRLGIDYYIVPDFAEFKDFEPEAFIKDVLVDKLSAKVLCCGSTFTFGKNARGDVALLQKLCEQHGIKLIVTPDVLESGEVISTSRIRTLLKKGDIPQANKLLGRPYSYDYVVVHGNRFGRTIDSPTINQHFDEGMLMPREGVYASYVIMDCKKKPSITNIGVRPTVDGLPTPISETYILDYTGNLYKKRIEVHLVEYLREEKKFDSVDELKIAIQQDAEHVQQIFNPKAVEKEPIEL